MPNEELDDREKQLTINEYNKHVQNLFSFYSTKVQNLIAYEYQDRVPGRFNLFNALDQMVADSDFVCNVELLANKLSESGHQVYRYHYNHRSSVDPWPTWSGSKHGDEIEMVFGVPLQTHKIYKSKQIKFSHDIINYWINFVQTGSPNTSGSLHTWPSYKSPSWIYLNLTAGEIGLTGTNTMNAKCQFRNNILQPFIPEQFDKEDGNVLDSPKKCQ